MMRWHRLFGVTCKDFFADTGFKVELEKDLSQKQQLLDMVIIRKVKDAVLTECPDGWENLTDHNLITFKARKDILNRWAVEELIGHYVNYRKLVSGKTLIPEDRFNLYAITMHYPQNLNGSIELAEVKRGVYEVQWGLTPLRVLVLSRMPRTPRNAVWLLFSGNPDLVRFGNAAYRWKDPNISTIVQQLYNKYKAEGIEMPYTLENYYHDYALESLDHLTVDERLKGLTDEQRLKGMTDEQRLKGMTDEQRLKGLSPEEERLLLQKLIKKYNGRSGD
ncbi:MAG: hypothetical protein QNK37_10120 [Acidobacteriota bacterium]|nr:hypothetical protein [Acidobacteriota bacterium]